jgi:hypothetical protein
MNAQMTTAAKLPSWAPPGSTNHHTRRNWQDLALFPLTDWVNIYNDHGGDSGRDSPDRRDDYHTNDCPGVLHQECTELVRTWCEPRPDGTTGHYQRTEPTDRETQLVPAELGRRVVGLGR